MARNADRIRRRHRSGGWGLRVYASLFIGFIVTPLAMIVVFSLNDSPFYAFPLKGFTLGWYRELFEDPRFLTGLRNSLGIAVTSGIIATALGTGFAYGLVRQRFRWKWVVALLGFLPLVTPTLIMAVTFQTFFVLAGIPLSRLTVVIAHSTYTIPLVALVVMSRLLALEATFEAAARDLGASAWQTFRMITLPLSKTAVQGGFMVAVLLSLNEFTIAFHTSTGFFTLPQLIYSMQRVGLQPTLLAYFSLVLVVVVVALLLLEQVVRAAVAEMQRRRAGG